jgi:hypothetical protein
MRLFIPVLDHPKYPKVSRLLKETALRCPKCMADQADLVVMGENCIISPRYFVMCNRCKEPGPYGRSIDSAIRQWNKPPGFFSTFIESWRLKRLNRRQKHQRHRQRQQTQWLYRFVP